jgi:hypothetical protein
MEGSIPFRLTFDGGKPRVEWVVASGARFTEPFFEDTIGRLIREDPANRGGSRPSTPLDALRHVEPGAPPAAFIFHVSRCGSTLLTQVLAAVPRQIVASEPPILDDLLRYPGASDEDRIAWLRGALHSMGQPNAAGGDRLFVKFSSWHIFYLPLIDRAFPGVPKVFVFRSPLEVLVSLMRRPSLALVRGTVTPGQLGMAPEVRDTLRPEEHAAAVLGAIYREALRHRAQLTPVDYGRLPGWVWKEMPGIACTSGDRALMEAAGARDSKNPAEPFAPDTPAKIGEAGAALQSASARWTEPHYARWLSAVCQPGP